MNNRFTVKYEIEDGYIGAARPQHFTINAGDIPPGATDEQLTSLLYDFAHEDMMQKVGAAIDNADDFLAWAKAQMSKAGGGVMPAHTKIYGSNQLPRDETMTGSNRGDSMTGDQGSEFVAQSAVAKCCCNSAQMLHVADDDGNHTAEKRRTFQKYNRGQARLLIEAAKQADEMLTALKVAKENLQPLGDCPALDIICSAIERAEGKS